MDIVKLVRRFAGATTDAILDPSMLIFQTPDIEGFISYRVESGRAIVFGDPTCAEADKAQLAEAFHLFASDMGKSIIYVSASKPFADWAIQNICKGLIEFGEELIVDPVSAPIQQTGEHASLVRRKVKRALQEGVEVEEYLTNDPALEESIEQVGDVWVKGRQGPQLHISDVYLFDNRFGKRWFYAKLGNDVIGTISLNHMQAQNGWLLNHLMVLEEAPPGTSELLVTSALKALKNEGCRMASFGLVSAKGLGKVEGLGFFSSCMAHIVFQCAKKIAHLDGLNMFWRKFNPESKPCYLLFSNSSLGLSELICLKRALSGNSKGK